MAPRKKDLRMGWRGSEVVVSRTEPRCCIVHNFFPRSCFPPARRVPSFFWGSDCYKDDTNGYIGIVGGLGCVATSGVLRMVHVSLVG